MKKLEIFDSTLRDGAQSSGISFSADDKLNIIKILDELGVAYIEAGNPFASAGEREFFKTASKLKLKRSKLVAFGSTRRKNANCREDGNLNCILESGAPAAAIFGKSWDMHVTDVLGATLEENLEMIESSVKYLKDGGMEVIFDAEHFFDGYKRNPEYALSTLKAACRGGADCLSLCDTNGGMFPVEIYDAVRAVKSALPGAKIAIHCHNDGGLAVANSIAATEAGAESVQGTLLGFGERCGNANLSTIIGDLQLKRDCECIPAQNLKNLYQTAVKLADIANITIPKGEPYIGTSAFAHKAGMHADGVLKSSSSFEHIDPETVGNHRKFLLSEMSGKSAIINKISSRFPHLKKDSPEMNKITDALKGLEQSGYQFEAAEASFILTVKKILGEYKPAFELVNFKCINEQPAIEGKVASAILKIRVDGVTKITASDGEGPVHAIDLALRNALSDFYPEIKKISLKDYKVRVLDSKEATAAKVRVLITSTDGKDIWTTVGVSDDIIQASWTALTDSIEYSLLK